MAAVYQGNLQMGQMNQQLQHIDPLTRLPEALRHQSAQLFGSALAPHPNTGDLRRYDGPLSNYNDITTTYVDRGVIGTWAGQVMNAIVKNRAAGTLFAVVPLYLTNDLQFSFSWSDPFLIPYEQMSEMGIPAMITDTKHSAQSNMSFFKLGAEIESNYAADPRFGNEALELKVSQLIEAIYLTFHILIIAGLMRFSAQNNERILGDEARDDPERAKRLRVAEAAGFGAAALGVDAFREAIFRYAEVQEIDAVVVHPNPRLMHSNASSRPVRQTIIDALDGTIHEKEITLDRHSMGSVNYDGAIIDILAIPRLYESITKRTRDQTKVAITLSSLFRGTDGHGLSPDSKFPGAIQVRSMTASHYSKRTFTPLDCLLQSPYYNEEGVPSETLHMFVDDLNNRGYRPDDLYDGDASNGNEQSDAYENPRTATVDIHNSSNPFTTFDPASGRNYVPLMLGGFSLSAIQPQAMAAAATRIAAKSSNPLADSMAIEELLSFARKCRAQDVTPEYTEWVYAQVQATNTILSDETKSTALGIDPVLEVVTDGATGGFALTADTLPRGVPMPDIYPPGYDTLSGILWLAGLDLNTNNAVTNSFKTAIEHAKKIAPLFSNRKLTNYLHSVISRSLILTEAEIPMWLGPNAHPDSLLVEVFLQYSLGTRNNGPLFCVKGASAKDAVLPIVSLIVPNAKGDALAVDQAESITIDNGAVLSDLVNAAFPVAEIGVNNAAYAANAVLSALLRIEPDDEGVQARALLYAAQSRTFKERIVGDDPDFDAEVARLVAWAKGPTGLKRFQEAGSPKSLNIGLGYNALITEKSRAAGTDPIDVAVVRVPLRLSRKWITAIRGADANSNLKKMMAGDPAGHFTRYYPNNESALDQLLKTADLSARHVATSPSQHGLSAERVAEYHRERARGPFLNAVKGDLLDGDGEWIPQHKLSDAQVGFIGPFAHRLRALQDMALSPLEEVIYLALVFAINESHTFSRLYRKAGVFFFRASYWAMRMRLVTRQAIAISRTARSLVLASSPVRAVVEEDKVGDLTTLASSFRAAMCQTTHPAYLMMTDVELCELVGGFTAQVSKNPNDVNSRSFGLGDLMALPEPLSLQLQAPVAMRSVEGADAKSRSPHASFNDFFLALVQSDSEKLPIEHEAEFGVVWDYEENGWSEPRPGTGRLGDVRMHLPGAEKVLNGESAYFPQALHPRIAYQ